MERFLGIDLRVPTMGDFEKFGNFINDTLDAAKKKFSDGRVALGEFYASLADGKVKEFTDKQADAFKNFFRNLTLDGLKQKLDNAKAAAKTFLEQFDIHIPTLSDFWELLDKVAGGIWNLGEKFQNAAGKVAGFFSSLFPSSGRQRTGLAKPVSDEMGGMAESVEGSVARTKTAFDYLIGAIDFVMNVAGHIVSRFVDIFRPVWDALLQGFSDVIQDTKNLSILDIMKIATVFMSNNMYSAITQVMDSLGGLGSAIADIGENISGIVEGAKGVFEGLQDTLSDFTKEINSHALINIAIAVAILAGSVIALSMVDVEAGLNALFSISLLVGEMLGAMSLLSKVAAASGKLTINMGQGDTDGIDSNGYIYIKGGTVAITAQFPFDYDSGAELSGGTVTVNGEEVDEISNQFGGGGPGGGFPGGDNGNNDNGFPGGSEPPEGQSPGEGQMPPGQSSGGGDHHH